MGSFFTTVVQEKLLKKTKNMGIQNQQQILRRSMEEPTGGPSLAGYEKCVGVGGSVSSRGMEDQMGRCSQRMC